jgi:hypothetical protein
MMSAPGGQDGFAAALLDPSRQVPPGIRSAGRFAVYRNNVVVGLVDALAETYPAVLALVGGEFFRAAAGEFVRAHPPRSPVLIDYGGTFPGWIAAFPPAAGVPYLGDVARLEWTWSRAWNAADAEPVDARALAALPADALAGARLTLHPSVMIVVSDQPVVSLWAEATGRDVPGRVDLGTRETALVSRPQAGVEVRRIGTATAMFLAGLGRGMTLGAAAERAASLDGFDLAAEISALFGRQLVVGVEPTSTPALAQGQSR